MNNDTRLSVFGNSPTVTTGSTEMGPFDVKAAKTLRDELAMAAMTVALTQHPGPNEDRMRVIALASYKIADIMMEARSK